MSETSRWLICDRCDAREPAGVAQVNERLLQRYREQGWQITAGPNYCPGCVRALKYEREGR
jgi:hypothetical protein